MAQGITERQSETGRTDFNQEFPAGIGREAATVAAGRIIEGFTQTVPDCTSD